jgi:hypothetical protein
MDLLDQIYSNPWYMRNNITPSQPEDDSFLTARLSIIQERLRQAHRSFDFALIATALSFGISLVGAPVN